MPSPAVAESTNKNGKTRLIVGCVVCLLIGLFLGHAVTYHLMHHDHGRSFLTPYQAVQLTNGAVYYGKLSGYGSRNPVLTDVFYIVSKTDPETKQVSNLLVKRGKELHGPDRMYINPSQIVMVEPVGTDSKVAQLIEQASQ
jgi:small nuclear ribonucleoprotein (snRNP)-like protein